MTQEEKTLESIIDELKSDMCNGCRTSTVTIAFDKIDGRNVQVQLTVTMDKGKHIDMRSKDAKSYLLPELSKPQP